MLLAEHAEALRVLDIQSLPANLFVQASIIQSVTLMHCSPSHNGKDVMMLSGEQTNQQQSSVV